MKQIIDGVAYDTETSTEVTSGDGQPHSMGWWCLYRTQLGAFFEVISDHSGENARFIPLTDQQARAFLERQANHLVEEYFGIMPEPRPMRFSRRTMMAAIEILDHRLSQAELSRYLRQLGSMYARGVRGETVSAKKRLNDLIDMVDADPTSRVEGDEFLQDALVDKAVSLLPPTETESPWQEPSTLTPAETFLRALDLDGFTVTDGQLRRTLPATLKLPEAEDEIARLLNKHRFTVAKGHLDQAFAAHTEGRWASANSQIRNFLDGLLDEIAERIDPSAAGLGSGQPRRTKLAAAGFLSRPLNEWDDNGLGFINGLVKRLHPQGSHPGLSDQDDSTFRLHTVLLTARLLLARFDALGIT